MKKLILSVLFLVSMASFFAFVIPSGTYPADFGESLRDILGPSSCNWATTPMLRSYPVSKNDLQDCVKDLINSISEAKDKIRSKDLQIETLSLSVKTLQRELDLLRSQLEKLKVKGR